jgi:hypothetical protein
MRFLSDEWFAEAGAALGGVRAPQGAACRVQFVAGDEPWHLVAAERAPVELSPGALDAPDVELRWDRADALAVWRRERRGDEALATAVVRTSDYTGPPSPGDLASRPELDDLPPLPGASVVTQYHFSGGPFGTVAHVLVFEEGRLVRDQWGVVPDPDVVVRVPYEEIAYVRSGRHTILDAIEGGSLEGEIGPLALLAGILEHPAFEAAERATDDHGFVLAALGKLDADPAYTEAMERLAAATDPE